MSDDLPSGWGWGIAEASRPLSDDGYYQKRAYKRLPGSNQHVERFLQCVIDTAAMPPRHHAVRITYCTENGLEVTEHETLVNRSFTVPRDRRGDETEQRMVESTAEGYAVNKMADLQEYEP